MRSALRLVGVVILVLGMLAGALIVQLAIIAHRPEFRDVTRLMFGLAIGSWIMAGIGFVLLRAGHPRDPEAALETGDPYAWAHFLRRPLDLAAILMLVAAIPAGIFAVAETLSPMGGHVPGRLGVSSMSGLAAWAVGVCASLAFLLFRQRDRVHRRFNAARVIADGNNADFDPDPVFNSDVRTRLTSFGGDTGPRASPSPLLAAFFPSWVPNRTTGSFRCAMTWGSEIPAISVCDYFRKSQTYNRTLRRYVRDGRVSSQTVAVAPWNAGIVFQVSPLGIAGRVRRMFAGGPDMVEDNPKFSKRFSLTCADRDGVGRLFSGEVGEWFVRNPDWNLESDGFHLVMYRDGLIFKVDHFPSLALQLREIVAVLSARVETTPTNTR